MTFERFFHIFTEASNPEKRKEYLLKIFAKPLKKMYENVYKNIYVNSEGLNKDSICAFSVYHALDMKTNGVETVEEFAKEFIDRVIHHDPTNGKYSQWLAKRLLNLKDDPAFQDVSTINRLPEDFYKIIEDLEKHKKYGKKLKGEFESYKDINKITTFAHLERVGEELMKFEEKEKLADIEKSQSKDVKKIYVSDNYYIISPNTKEAACLYGANTRWCTAARSSHNAFDSYNQEGPLYIIIDRKANKKYQFHFETFQFMDEQDHSIDMVSFVEEHKEICKVLAQLAYDVKDYTYCALLDETVFAENIKTITKQLTADDMDPILAYYGTKYAPNIFHKLQNLFKNINEDIWLNTLKKDKSNFLDFIYPKQENYISPIINRTFNSTDDIDQKLHKILSFIGNNLTPPRINALADYLLAIMRISDCFSINYAAHMQIIKGLLNRNNSVHKTEKKYEVVNIMIRIVEDFYMKIYEKVVNSNNENIKKLNDEIEKSLKEYIGDEWEEQMGNSIYPYSKFVWVKIKDDTPFLTFIKKLTIENFNENNDWDYMDDFHCLGVYNEIDTMKTYSSTYNNYYDDDNDAINSLFKIDEETIWNIGKLLMGNTNKYFDELFKTEVADVVDSYIKANRIDETSQ